jgi:phage terminase large subunit
MSVTAPAALQRKLKVPFRPFGGALAMFECSDPEIMLSGPADTGKSRAILEKIHLLCNLFPKCRWAMVRKTRTSLTQSGMITFENKVLHPLDGVHFHGGDQEYRYPNGSVIVVAGLDNPTKFMSSEYDGVYIQEATEVSEDDWERVGTRLRNGVMPFQQLIGDCNPGPPSHWIYQRRNLVNETTGEHTLTFIESHHEDNPSITPQRLARLDNLTGVRKLRLRFGIWAAAEGMVYETYDPQKHLVFHFDPPKSWPRYWSVDFGYTHPFCWQQWVRDPEGRLFLHKELYCVQRLVKDCCTSITASCKRTNEPPPKAIICDHQAENRAQMEREFNMPTTPAKKDVRAGIQAVQDRLKPRRDGRPGLMLMRDSLLWYDTHFNGQYKGQPSRTSEEFESYVWSLKDDRIKGEEPAKEYDHGMDALRYMVMHLDAPSGEPRIRVLR